MHWTHSFAVSLLLLPLLLQAMIAGMVMITYYYGRKGVREVARIVFGEKPITRDKLDRMTFTQWWTDRSRKPQKRIR